MKTGTVYGVGLGPGAPDLMSLRARRLLDTARHIAFFRKAGCEGRAFGIVRDLVPTRARLFPMEYPVTTEIPTGDPRYLRLLSDFYVLCTAHLRRLAESGEDVTVLCEGDPFFYGSFMHIFERLKPHVPVQVVPGTTGMSAAWTATGHPMAWGEDVLTVLPGTLPESELARRMADSDAIVVMKIGRHIGKVRRALRSAGRHDDAWLVEYAAMPEQRVIPLAQTGDRVAPYFSIVIVHGHGRRP